MQAPSYPTPGSRRSPGCGLTSLRRAKSRRGLTLVEVILASFVMLLAISGSIVTMQYGFRALDTARKTTLASQIMQSEMERIRMLSWSRIQALPDEEKVSLDDIFPKNTQAEIATLNAINATFNTIRSVQSLADYDNEIREIRVTITWNGIDGMPQTRTSTTQYSKDGLYAYYYRVP